MISGTVMIPMPYAERERPGTAVMRIDRESRILSRQCFDHVSPWTDDKLIGKTLPELLGKEQGAMCLELIEHTITTGLPTASVHNVMHRGKPHLRYVVFKKLDDQHVVAVSRPYP
jgi:hypothetical protein